MLKYIILLTLLTPRIEFLALSGVNSDLRLDVVMILLASLLTLLRPLPIHHLYIIFGLIFICCLQQLILNGNPMRLVYGSVFYISIIMFSTYQRALSLVDAIFIFKYFLIVNVLLHCSDIFININSNHNLSFRYGVFNQHFAFAASIIISYYFLKLNGRNSKLIATIFYAGILLSGSRTLILAVILATSMEVVSTMRLSIRNILLLVGGICLGGTVIYVLRDAPSVLRLIRLFETLSLALGDYTVIARDPALAVRLSNVENYFSYLETIDNKFFYILFGGGPFNFLDYSIQFQKPGHFDILYFRLLSEFGVVSLLLLTVFLLNLLYRQLKSFPYVFVLIVGGLTSEFILTLKVGHIFFMTYLYLVNEND